MKHSCYLAVLTVATLALGSCNTFIGMGRDLQGAGAAMQNRGTTGTWDGSGANPNAVTPTAQNPYGVPAAQ
ncbi:hypothetical protein JIN77_14510 [Verrucomicrobiaceae bacterium R5-34]|nr:hypothetical protein [Verrucomicrobiaceae bacterium R5-34]